MNANQLIENLYKSVDAKDLNYLQNILAEDVRFRIGSHDAIQGIDAALAANRGFFAGIESMQHSIDQVWSQQDNVICHGQVNYIRLDGSEYSAPFATILKMQGDKIQDYLVYADISAL